MFGATQSEGRKAKTALDRSRLLMNKFERDLVDNVREFGWQANHILPDEEGPGFAYTIGFWLSLGAPEVVVCGLPQESGHALLWSLFRTWRDTEPAALGRPVSGLLEGLDCYFFPIGKAAYDDYPLSAAWFYGGNEFPCVQLVWPDPNGTFPWQQGFDQKFAADQPDLSDNGWVSHLRQ